MTKEKPIVTVTFEGLPGSGKTLLQHLLITALFENEDWGFKVDVNEEGPTTLKVQLKKLAT